MNFQFAFRLPASLVFVLAAAHAASVGLGGILFERREYPEAIRLWQDALSRNSGLVLVSTNLAMAQWRTGDRRAAESTVRQVIDLSPRFQPARDLLKRLQEGRRGRRIKIC